MTERESTTTEPRCQICGEIPKLAGPMSKQFRLCHAIWCDHKDKPDVAFPSVQTTPVKNPTTPELSISWAAAMLSAATGLTEKDSARAIVELISRRWALVPFACVKEEINTDV